MAAFIVLEGGDASGKSTQARRLADRLRSLGRDVVETFEPGATQAGAAIRALLTDDPFPHGRQSTAQPVTWTAAGATDGTPELSSSCRYTDGQAGSLGIGAGLISILRHEGAAPAAADSEMAKTPGG